jgi:double-stranded uracil-DNA glycosylase
VDNTGATIDATISARSTGNVAMALSPVLSARVVSLLTPRPSAAVLRAASIASADQQQQTNRRADSAGATSSGPKTPMESHKLPDVLASELRVIFVGTAAGRVSAARGEYYAHPGNRFWRTLRDIGLTPRLFEPREFSELLALGIGLTDMSKLGAGMDHQIAKHEFDRVQFEANVCRYRPRAIAFTSKKAASIWLGRSATSAIPYGRQSPTLPDFPAVFVLPSPSGAARSYWDIAPWQELADWSKAVAVG